MSGIDYIKEFLRNEGFRFDEKETFIAFKFEGTQYVAFRNSDSIYLQICIIFYDVTASNRVRCLEACNAVNAQKFMLKYTIDDDSVWCNYEFIPNSSTSAEDFMQILGMMNESRNLFYEKMK